MLKTDTRKCKCVWKLPENLNFLNFKIFKILKFKIKIFYGSLHEKNKILKLKFFIFFYGLNFAIGQLLWQQISNDAENRCSKMQMCLKTARKLKILNFNFFEILKFKILKFYGSLHKIFQNFKMLNFLWFKFCDWSDALTTDFEWCWKQILENANVSENFWWLKMLKNSRKESHEVSQKCPRTYAPKLGQNFILNLRPRPW